MSCTVYLTTNHIAGSQSVDGRRRSKYAGMCGIAGMKHVHLLICCSLFAPTKQIPLYTYSRLQGKTNNGGGSGWTVEGKELFNNLQQIVKADREKHASLTQAGSDWITFIKALYQCYLQRKENERHKNNGSNPDKQSKQKKPAHQCYDEFEDESDEEDRLQESSAAIGLEQLSEFAET